MDHLAETVMCGFQTEAPQCRDCGTHLFNYYDGRQINFGVDDIGARHDCRKCGKVVSATASQACNPLARFDPGTPMDGTILF